MPDPPSPHVAQLTGHRNVASLRNYAEADMKIQRIISATLSPRETETDSSAVCLMRSLASGGRCRVARQSSVTSSLTLVVCALGAACDQRGSVWQRYSPFCALVPPHRSAAQPRLSAGKHHHWSVRRPVVLLFDLTRHHLGYFREAAFECSPRDLSNAYLRF